MSTYGKGELIGDRYLVLGQKAGGMSQVYLTFDLSQNAQACRALKTVKRDTAWDQDAIQLIKQESASWVGLGAHSNIVQCFLAEEIAGIPYLILEWVSDEDGETRTVRDLLADRSVLPNQALLIARDLCSALLYCQTVSPGFAHGDLKPENILLGPEGAAKLSDFGLARTLSILRTGEPQHFYGTPPYMAPELWSGTAPDLKSDIYAFGCVLYELLEGRRPFQGRTAQALLRSIREDDPIAPELMNANWSRLILRCLGKDPSARPSGFQELANELEQLGQGRLRIATGGQKLSATEYGNQAVTLANAGQTEAALVAFAKALELDPGLARAHNNRAILYLRLNRHSEALLDWQKALEIDPNFVEAYSNRAMLHLQNENLDEALADAQNAVKLSPNWPTGLINLSQVYKKIGRLDDASNAVEEALRLDPQSTKGLLARADLRALQKSYTLAAQDFEKVAQSDGGEQSQKLQAFFQQALNLIRAGYSKKAFKLLDSLVRDTPEVPLFVGQFLMENSEPTAAMRYYHYAGQLGQPDAEELIQSAVTMVVRQDLDATAVKYTGYRNWADDEEGLLNDLTTALSGLIARDELPRRLDQFMASSSLIDTGLCNLFGDPKFAEALLGVVFPQVDQSTRDGLMTRLALYRSSSVHEQRSAPDLKHKSEAV